MQGLLCLRQPPSSAQLRHAVKKVIDEGKHNGYEPSCGTPCTHLNIPVVPIVYIKTAHKHVYIRIKDIFYHCPLLEGLLEARTVLSRKYSIVNGTPLIAKTIFLQVSIYSHIISSKLINK